MRLTTYHKQATVNAIMNDTPMVDYDERARKLVDGALFKDAPKEVQHLYKTNPGWLACTQVLVPVPGGLGPLLTRLVSPETPTSVVQTRYPELWGELVIDAKLALDQTDKRSELRRKLRDAFAGINTRKQALAAFPEFEKYLPAGTDVKANRSLPAISGLVTDLMNAGWPKESNDVKADTPEGAAK
jgi:hypothetical protein